MWYVLLTQERMEKARIKTLQINVHIIVDYLHSSTTKQRNIFVL